MAELLKIDPVSPDPRIIGRAALLLGRGEVIAFPTDTFYGLAANPFNAAAAETIFAIKGRSKGNPLLLLVDSIAMAERLARELPPEFYRLAKRFWPGPLTMVVNASPEVPEAVTAQTGTIGLRLPDAPVAVALIRAAGCPVTATSANLSGDPNPASALDVERSLGARLPLILDAGPSRSSTPSTVLKLTGAHWEIAREGAISRDEIAACLAAGPPFPAP